MVPPSAASGRSHGGSPPKLDLAEHGAPRDGVPQTLDRRLFVQLLVFRADPEAKLDVVVEALESAVRDAGIGAVIYDDVNDPRGIGLLVYTEEPAELVTHLRPALALHTLAPLVLRPEMTMTGRTYSSGYEPDLAFWMLQRPRQTVQNEAWPWAVWYPLRRSGAFEKLDGREKGAILREHATIGRAYGEADLAHDVRLACHGMDANDNEFLVGLVGATLHPLSHVVQHMRGTKQTSEYISQMGPFFVGHARTRLPLPGDSGEA